MNLYRISFNFTSRDVFDKYAEAGELNNLPTHILAENLSSAVDFAKKDEREGMTLRNVETLDYNVNIGVINKGVE